MFKSIVNTAFIFGRNLTRNSEFEHALCAAFVLKKYGHFDEALKELNKRFPESKWKSLTPTERVNLDALKRELINSLENHNAICPK